MKLKFYIADSTEIPTSYPRDEVLARLAAANIELGNSLVLRPNMADIILLFEKNCYKWYRLCIDAYRSSRLIRESANRIIVINDDDFAPVFFPGYYTSLIADKNYILPTAAIAYFRSINPYVEAYRASKIAPTILASFRGQCHASRLRRRLALWARNQTQLKFTIRDVNWGDHSTQFMEIYAREIIDSKFILCPRGSSPSTYRTYEALALGRPPIILSDKWVRPEGPDWDAISIQLPEKRLNCLPMLLDKVTDEKWKRMSANASQQWSSFCSPSAIMQYILENLSKLFNGMGQWNFSTLWDFWHSHAFLSARHFTLIQRVALRMLYELDKLDKQIYLRLIHK